VGVLFVLVWVWVVMDFRIGGEDFSSVVAVVVVVVGIGGVLGGDSFGCCAVWGLERQK
jgi:hypothetical protein